MIEQILVFLDLLVTGLGAAFFVLAVSQLFHHP